MYLSVKQAARLLDISDKTIYRWVSEGAIPAMRVKGQYRFNRVELLEWVSAQRMTVSPDLLLEPESAGVPLPRLRDVLIAHDIHYRVEGADKARAISNALFHLRLPQEVDREALRKVILAREDLGTTAVGRGIAIPHVRNPLVLHIEQPTLGLCFLEKPVEFQALDGVPVHILFMLVSPTLRSHLHLMSRIAAVLQDPRFFSALKAEAGREALLALMQTVEDEFAGGDPPGAHAGIPVIPPPDA